LDNNEITGDSSRTVEAWIKPGEAKEVVSEHTNE